MEHQDNDELEFEKDGMHTTLHGFEKCSSEMFKKLGLMVLAKREGYDYKIIAYLKTLDDLITNLKARIEITQETDRKLNLHILKNNVWSLRCVAYTLLKSDMINDLLKKNKKSMKTHKSTKRHSSRGSKRRTLRRSSTSIF